MIVACSDVVCFYIYACCILECEADPSVYGQYQQNQKDEQEREREQLSGSVCVAVLRFAKLECLFFLGFVLVFLA